MRNAVALALLLGCSNESLLPKPKVEVPPLSEPLGSYCRAEQGAALRRTRRRLHCRLGEPVTPDESYAQWFEPFFSFVHDNTDVVRSVSYINSDWDTAQHWGMPTATGATVAWKPTQ